MDIALSERSQVALCIGIITLIVGVGLFYLGFPTYRTSITEQEPSEEAMAAAVESYSVSEIDTVPFAVLSSAEQTAVTSASQSPQLTYTDHGASDGGSHFQYRNDVVNDYFVEYNGSIYLVHVVVAMNPLSMGAGVLGQIAGIALITVGIWYSRHGT